MQPKIFALVESQPMMWSSMQPAIDSAWWWQGSQFGSTYSANGGSLSVPLIAGSLQFAISGPPSTLPFCKTISWTVYADLRDYTRNAAATRFDRVEDIAIMLES